MARRRKDIKKRRKVQEDQPASASPDELYETEEPEEAGEDVAGDQEVVDEVRDDEIVLQAGGKKTEPKPEKVVPESAASRGPGGDTRGQAVPSGWFGQHKDNLLLGLLVFYVLLLGLGTVGELFEIVWILDLPLFR